MCWNTNTYQESLCTFSSNAEQGRGTSQLNVAMCDDHRRSDGLNGIWLKSVDSQLSPSFFHTSYTAHTCTQRCTNPVYLACLEQRNNINVFYFELFLLSWCECKAGGGLEVNWAAVVVEVKSTCVFGQKEKKKKGLPLFIKPRQIQLACGLPSNPINLLSCESTQQLLPISHFFQPLIRSAQDIQWGSLQPHLWCYSCHGGFKKNSSFRFSRSLCSLPFNFLQLSVFLSTVLVTWLLFSSRSHVKCAIRPPPCPPPLFLSLLIQFAVV